MLRCMVFLSWQDERKNLEFKVTRKYRRCRATVRKDRIMKRKTRSGDPADHVSKEMEDR
jgi:hypothetical protein